MWQCDSSLIYTSNSSSYLAPAKNKNKTHMSDHSIGHLAHTPSTHTNSSTNNVEETNVTTPQATNTGITSGCHNRAYIIAHKLNH